MKNFKTIMAMGLVLVCGISCTEKDDPAGNGNDGAEAIEAKKIELIAPDDDAAIELEAGENILFSWSDAGASAYTLLFSTDETFTSSELKDIQQKKFIKGTSYEFRSEDFMKNILNKMDLKEDGPYTLFWRVMTTAQTNKIKDSDTRSFTVTRGESQVNPPVDLDQPGETPDVNSGLVSPEDASAIVLSFDKADETACTFKWGSVTGATEGYELVFSASEDLADPVKFDVVEGSEVSLTHNQLQTLVRGLSLEPYSETTVYWNVCDKAAGDYISLTDRTVMLTGMMIFDDVRGSETIRYEVSRITLLDGTTQIWLSSNLRATKYTDGTDIQEDPDVFAPGYKGDIDPVLYELFGGYYHTSIKNEIVPEGWRLPAKADFENLVAAAKHANAVDGGNAAVLLYDHTDFWKETDTGNAFLTDAEKNLINEWNMNFVPAGMIGNDSQMNNAMTRYCYFQCSDEAVPFWGFDANGYWDGGWETKCSVRLIMK